MDCGLFPGENEKERLKKTLRSLGVAFLVCRLSWLRHIMDLMVFDGHGIDWTSGKTNHTRQHEDHQM